MTFPQRITAYLVAGAIVAGLLMYLFGRIDVWLGARDREITQHSRLLVQQHAANVRWRAKLEAAERRIQASAAAAHDSANRIRIEIAQLPIDLRGPKIVHVARLDSTAYAMCSVALYTCQQRATLAEQETHRLTYQLGQQMKVRDKRCGVFAGYGVSVFNDVQRDADGVATSTIRARFAWQLGVGCRLLRIPFLP